MPKIDIGKSWDKVARTWHTKFEPLFGKDDLLWGPYGPWESKARLLPSLRSKKVLVLGCGSGPDVAYLVKRGAKVTGVDLSREQLKLAKERLKARGLTAQLVRANLNTLNPTKFKSRNFDLIISNYAFQYADDLSRLFTVCVKFLKREGRLVFSLDHPVLYATYKNKMGKNREKSLDAFDYLNPRTIYWHFRVEHTIPAYSYHRPISTILNALISAGFSIKQVLEPLPSVPPRGGYKESEKLAKRLPYTLIVQAKKAK